MRPIKFASNPQDVRSSFTVLLNVMSLFGLRILNEDTAKRSKVQILVALCCVVISSGTSYLFFCSVYHVQTMSNVYKWCFILYNFGMLSRAVFTYMLAVKNVSVEAGLYKSVDEFDGELRKMGRSKDLSAGYRSLERKCFCALGASVCSYAIVESFRFAMGTDFYDVAILFNQIILNTIGNLSKIYFYVWSQVLQERYGLLNDRLDVVRKHSNSRKPVVVSVYKFEKDISLIVDKHKDLTDLARNVNAVFQVDIVWHFLLIFNVIFANYYFCFSKFKSGEETSAQFWYAFFKGLVFFAFDFVVLIRSCRNLCDEAARTKEILCHMKADVYDDNSHRLIIASIYELNENKLAITACSLFDVNYSTLFVMFATIANYIFIMNQLDTSTAPVTSTSLTNLTTENTLVTESVS